MTKWGKRRSDNQSYPKTRKSRLGKKGSLNPNGLSLTKTSIKIPHQIESVEVGTNNPDIAIKNIGESMDDTFYKVDGVTAEPQLGRVVVSEFYVKVTDLSEMEEWDGAGYDAQLILIPKLKNIHPKIIKRIADNYNHTVDELKSNPDLLASEMLRYGSGITIGRSQLGNDKVKLAKDLAQQAQAHSAMIGFFMDSETNLLGVTGWDKLREFIRGDNATEFARRKALRDSE